ncbi:MAG: tryptophan synthase subunit alpha [Alphaproteobacteria bacterium]|nr:tryptophan synthase subunit alpha [Alphaproteobacteria bacterium]MCB9975337.1 tryptophan synthase subunit alpha [Rhodospirillales bacterium]
MKRLGKVFESLRTENRKGLIAFIMGGDPDVETSTALLKALPSRGVDVIEIGMPFSDPMADGPVIQMAGQRALEAGCTLRNVLDMVVSFRKDNQDTPLVLMGYANPVYRYGVDKFALDCAEAGVDGVIIVDLPPEEDQAVREALGNQFVDMIRLITPTSDAGRLETILDGATGFLYYVSITGITGAAKAKHDKVAAHIEKIRAKTDLPIAVGFGIKTPNDAQEMSALGDAVVVGSSIVEKIAHLSGKSGKVDQGAPEMTAVLDHIGALSGALKPAA